MSWRGLYRKFHCTDSKCNQWAKYKLSDAEMMYYIATFSPDDNIMYPEDFEIVEEPKEPWTNSHCAMVIPSMVRFYGSTIRLRPEHPRYPHAITMPPQQQGYPPQQQGYPQMPSQHHPQPPPPFQGPPAFHYPQPALPAFGAPGSGPPHFSH